MVLTDMSVMKYVRRRRLTLAAQELALTDVRVIDIALNTAMRHRNLLRRLSSGSMECPLLKHDLRTKGSLPTIV